MMAKATIKYPDGFLEQLANLGSHTDEIIDSALEAGGKIVLDAVRSSLQSAIGRGTVDSQSTGELVASLGLSPAKIDRKGDHNVKIGFNEPRRQQNKAKGKRSYYVRTNAMIANVLEYGRAGVQPPRPFLAPAKRASRKPAIDAMQAEIERRVSAL